MSPTAELRRTGRRTLTIDAEPQSIREARQWVVEAAEPFVAPERRSELELVISEVVTNAVRHGSPGDEVLVAVTPKDGYLCVQVTDSGAGLAPRPRAHAPDENGGWGFFLIEHLTRRWGLTRENRNTRVWFELDFGRTAAA